MSRRKTRLGLPEPAVATLPREVSERLSPYRHTRLLTPVTFCLVDFATVSIGCCENVDRLSEIHASFMPQV